MRSKRGHSCLRLVQFAEFGGDDGDAEVLEGNRWGHCETLLGSGLDELRKGDLDKTRFDRDDLELEGLLALPLEAHHVRIGTLGYTARIKIRGLGKRRTPSRAAKRRE